MSADGRARGARLGVHSSSRDAARGAKHRTARALGAVRRGAAASPPTPGAHAARARRGTTRLEQSTPKVDKNLLPRP